MFWRLPSWPGFPYAKSTVHSPCASQSCSACGILTIWNVLCPTLHTQHPFLKTSPQSHLLWELSLTAQGEMVSYPLILLPCFSSGGTQEGRLTVCSPPDLGQGHLCFWTRQGGRGPEWKECQGTLSPAPPPLCQSPPQDVGQLSTGQPSASTCTGWEQGT